MGRPFTSVGRAARQFYRAFAEIVAQQHGGIVSPWAQKLLRTATKAYAAARRVDLILMRAGEPGAGGKLTHEQFLGYLDRSLKFEAECDRTLKSLGLDKEIRLSALEQGRLLIRQQQTDAG
jgi:hypothetical protein